MLAIMMVTTVVLIIYLATKLDEHKHSFKVRRKINKVWEHFFLNPKKQKNLSKKSKFLWRQFLAIEAKTCFVTYFNFTELFWVIRVFNFCLRSKNVIRLFCFYSWFFGQIRTLRTSGLFRIQFEMLSGHFEGLIYFPSHFNSCTINFVLKY